ncbi:hypothetical protein ACFLX2_00105 [Candidatus Dependentiae bacterium]
MLNSFLLLAVVAPVLAMLFRPRTAAASAWGFFAVKWLLFGCMPITFGLPTTCACANWSLYGEGATRKQKLMRMVLGLVLPVVCILLFISHPVGSKAFVYSLYWLIPIGSYLIYFFVRSSLLIALSSTFIAHAVGSVMWLYLVPTLPEKWLALMPVVAFERLAIVAGSVVLILLFPRLFSILKNKRFSLNVVFSRASL